MLKQRIGTAGLAGLWLLASAASPAEELKIQEQNGHISPVRARVSFQDGSVRDVVVRGTGGPAGMYQYSGYFTHALFVRVDEGVSKRMVWLDSIAAIRGLDHVRTTRSEFTVVLKNGSQFPAMFVASTIAFHCDEGRELTKPEEACSFLYTGAADDGLDVIDMRKLQTVEFLPQARRDRAGNFMFDNWRFSPFTGERLQ